MRSLWPLNLVVPSPHQAHIDWLAWSSSGISISQKIYAERPGDARPCAFELKLCHLASSPSPRAPVHRRPLPPQ